MPDSAAIAMSDAQPKAGPALSAQSDLPVIDVHNALPNDDAPAEVVEPEVKTAEEVAAETADPKEPKEDNTDPAVKRAITKERNRARAADEALTAERAKTAQLAAALEALTKKPEPEKPADRPSRADYDDPDAYETALEAYVDARATERATQAERDRQKTESVREQTTALVDTFSKRVDAFKADHADFDEVWTDDLPVSMVMTSAIMNAENGPDLAYYLAKNPEEAARIFALPDVSAVFEMGRITAKLAEPATQVRAKPAPIKPLTAQRSGSGEKDVNDMTTEEYAAYRQAKLKAESGQTAH